MKIIKTGVDPQRSTINITCRNCKTELEVNRGDCKYNSDQREGDYYSRECPTCGETINFSNPQWKG